MHPILRYTAMWYAQQIKLDDAVCCSNTKTELKNAEQSKKKVMIGFVIDTSTPRVHQLGCQGQPFFWIRQPWFTEELPDRESSNRK